MYKPIIKNTLSLFLLCIICTALVAGTFIYTKPVIANRRLALLRTSYQEVLPQVGELQELPLPTAAAAGKQKNDAKTAATSKKTDQNKNDAQTAATSKKAAKKAAKDKNDAKTAATSEKAARKAAKNKNDAKTAATSKKAAPAAEAPASREQPAATPKNDAKTAATAPSDAKTSATPASEGSADLKLITGLLQSTKNGVVNGYLYTVTTKGYGGNIIILVGVEHPTGKIAGIKIIQQTETPGLGGRAGDLSFTEQFKNKSLQKPLVLSKQATGQEIQALTAATITSKAILRALNAVQYHYKNFCSD